VGTQSKDLLQKEKVVKKLGHDPEVNQVIYCLCKLLF